MYWIFVAISCLFILPTTYIVLKALFTERSDQDRDNYSEIDFLKNQLLQIDNDIKSGIGGPDDKFNQTSISRKILTLQKDVTNKTKVINSPNEITFWVSVIIIITCLFGTHLTYLLTNDNYFNSDKLATLDGNEVTAVQKNLSQEKIEELLKEQISSSGSELIGSQSDNLEQLVNELKIALSNRPNDIRGQKLLVKNSAKLGDFITSRKAQKKVLELLKEKASATDYARYAELCVVAASGFVSSEAANAINKAISLDANNSAANFYLSLFLLQKDKKTAAFKIWVKLLKEEQSSSKWIMMLVPQIKYVSLGLKMEATNADKPNRDHLNSRLIFLQVLEAMETRLNRYNGPIEHWISLVQSYRNLKLSKKAEINVEKIKSQFLLSNSQVKELENNLELK